MRIQKLTAVSYSILLILLYSVGCLAASSRKGMVWRPMKVSYARLFDGSVEDSSHKIPVASSLLIWRVSCSRLCQETVWCNIFCHDLTSPTACNLFQFYIVPNYQEANLADAVDCYMNAEIPQDYAVGATIYGDDAYTVAPLKVKENLIDGIYDNRDKNQCYQSNDFYNPWFKLDLGSVKPIRRIMLLMLQQTSGDKFYDMEIRAGVEDLPEDQFNQYTFIGMIESPVTPGQECLYEMDPPLEARYVTVQRWSDTATCPAPNGDDNKLCHLQVCHIEING